MITKHGNLLFPDRQRAVQARLAPVSGLHVTPQDLNHRTRSAKHREESEGHALETSLPWIPARRTYAPFAPSLSVYVTIGNATRSLFIFRLRNGCAPCMDPALPRKVLSNSVVSSVGRSHRMMLTSKNTTTLLARSGARKSELFIARTTLYNIFDLCTVPSLKHGR